MEDTGSALAELTPDSFELARFSGANLIPRNRLVSMMLQDRGALRVISAPHGYGKTLLAYEYAKRVFGSKQVVWVDGSAPEFLQSLDEGHVVPCGGGDEESANLVVIDDLPSMDQQRIDTFARCSDELIGRGCEVVVTTLPSRDWLRSTQPDRILIAACDLVVTERDVQTVGAGADEAVRKAVLDLWGNLAESLMGHVPCCVWGDGAQEAYPCLRGFFEEDLEGDFLKAAFAMLILGRGTCKDLERLGAKMPEELLRMAARDYLFLGIDLVQREFDTGYVNVGGLKEAIEEAGVHNLLLSGAFPVHEKALGLLLESGSTQRAIEVMDAFCASSHCEAWLGDCGWELVDAGEERLLGVLVARCREEVMGDDAEMQAMRAWMCGMTGATREAAYYSRAAIRLVSDSDEARQPAHPVLLMAQLAILAFTGQKRFELSEARMESVRVNQEVGSSAEFMAAVASLCTIEELERATAVLRGDLAPASILGSDEEEVDENRVSQLSELFERHAHRYGDCLPVRVAVHLLSCVRSMSARELLHRYGCGLLISMRQKGVSSFSQAIVLSDLWRSGYFGAAGKIADVKDAKLLSQASALIMKMCRMAGREAPAIPWEQAKGACAPVQSAKKGSKGKRKRQAPSAESIPVASVKLFGGLEVVVGEKYVPRSKWTTRALQLFAILVMNQGKDVSREVIFQQMWPDLSRTRALDNFYTAWSRMQALLGEGPYLSRHGEFCSVSARYVTSDIAEFDRLSKRILVERDNISTVLDIYARMETLYRGGLLPSEKGNDFINKQRRRYQSIFVDAMISGACKSLEAKDSRIALWFARKAIEEDPKREDVYATLMRVQMAAGQRCSAIRTYFQCKEFLRDELGLDPSSDTQALYEQLITSDPSLLKLAALASMGM